MQSVCRLTLSQSALTPTFLSWADGYLFRTRFRSILKDRLSVATETYGGMSTFVSYDG